jgi:hypothetical protein
MSRSTVPVHIRPHLVPFFFKEFEGIEALHLNRKVKAAKISTKKPLGKFIRLLLERSPRPEQADKFQMFLSIQDREHSREFFGEVYKCVNGSDSVLKRPQPGVQLINDHLEDIFRTSLIYFVEGHIKYNSKAEIRQAVDYFLLDYDLYEHSFGIESLRRYYYRVIENQFKLKRMQGGGK